MKTCTALECTETINEEVSLVFCPVHEFEFQATPELMDRAAAKKDAGWNVLIFKEKK